MNRSEAIALLKKANQYLGDEDFVLSPEDRPRMVKWLDALRSGKYEQGNEHLFDYISESKRKGQYCCLGVYCKEILGASNRSILGATYPTDYAFPLSEDAQEALASLNDGNVHRDIEPYTFSQIADIVEAVWLS